MIAGFKKAGVIALSFLLAANAGIDAITGFNFDKKLHIRFGIGASGDYFAKSDTLSVLGGGLSGGAFEQEFDRFTAVENSIELVNPSDDQGGCPDVAGVPLKTARSLGGLTAPAQIFSIQGKACEIANAEGGSLLMLGLDIELTFHYNFYRDFFIHSGFLRSVIFPAAYSARFRYLGESTDIQINGLVDPVTSQPITSIAADILIDSHIYTEHSGYIYQFPLLVGIDFYRKENTRLYLSLGPVFSLARYSIQTRATQSVTVQADGQVYDLSNDSYIDTENTETVFTMGIATHVGGQYQLTDKLSVYVEFRWLKSGSTTTIKGTEIEEGKEYASDTFAAQALETVAPRSTAKALQKHENKSGARTANGLDIGYQARWMIGASYTL